MVCHPSLFDARLYDVGASLAADVREGRESMSDLAPSGSAISVSARKRLCAWLIDFAVLAVMAVGVMWATYTVMLESLHSIADVGSIGVTRFMSSHGDWQKFGTDAGIDLLHNMRFYAACGLGTVVLLAATYYWLSTAVTNRTLGLAVVDLRLGRAADPSVGPGWSHSLVWAMLRAVTDIGIFVAACVAPMFGAFALAAVLWILSVTWLLASGLIAARSGRSLVDRLGAVVLVPAGSYAAAARVARTAAGTASIQVQNLAGQAKGIAGQVRATGPVRVQSTVAATDKVRQLAADRARQAVNSDQAARAVDTGRRAAKAGLRFTGEVKRRFDDRRG
jgi:hypothetical protein